MLDILFYIIASLVCFAVSIGLFTPSMRPFPLYQPMAFFSFFEGVWFLVSCVVISVWSNESLMCLLQSCMVIIFGVWCFISMIKYIRKSKNSVPSDETVKEAVEETSIEKSSKDKKISAEK